MKIEQIEIDVKEIKDFLLGNDLNNKKGIGKILEEHEKQVALHDRRITSLEEHRAIMTAYTNLVKFVFGGLLTSLIGLVIYFLQKY